MHFHWCWYWRTNVLFNAVLETPYQKFLIFLLSFMITFVKFLKPTLSTAIAILRHRHQHRYRHRLLKNFIFALGIFYQRTEQLCQIHLNTELFGIRTLFLQLFIFLQFPALLLWNYLLNGGVPFDNNYRLTWEI